GDLGGFAGESVYQVGVKFALRKHAGASSGDSLKIGDPEAVDCHEGVEHRRDQDRAALVFLRLGEVVLRVRCERFPRASIWVPLADGVSESAVGAGCHAKLLRKRSEQISGAGDVATRFGDLISHDRFDTEALE